MTKAIQPRDSRAPDMGKDRGLWCAVIHQAISEAKGEVVAATSAVNRQRIIDEARDWLTRPNRGFNEVCHLAGLDPVAVRERAQRMFAASEPGVVKNLPTSQGTGGGSAAQDFSEIEFSQ